MTTKTKMALTYLGGIVTGIVLTFAICIVIAARRGSVGSTDSNVVMFERPQQVVDAQKLNVIQVFPNGSALAMVKDFENYGTVVALQAMEGGSYYDDQKITIPQGMCLRQIGTYRYMNRENMEKTVPIVQMFDK